MTFKEYVNKLVYALEQNPELGDLTAVYATDEEGNSYESIHYSASNKSRGNFDGGDFVFIDEFEDYELEDSDVNAICVN